MLAPRPARSSPSASAAIVQSAASVIFHAQDISMSAEGTVEAPPAHSSLSQDHDDIECESPSQPSVNVSRDMYMISSQEYSQAPPIGATARSQQPSPEFLGSLGIKVRDFAYENTLPAIVPVPRVPRQVQPAPVRALKRLQRDWDDKEGTLNSLSPSVVGSKKHKSLERRPTEPLQEPVVQHTRTLERITVKRVCSILTPPSRSTLPTTPRTRFSASPPTSPLTPLSRFASLESEPVQTSPAYPFVVHVNDTSMVPASQLDAEDSQPLSLRSVLYTRVALDSRLSPCSSPAPSPPQNASPAPLMSSFLELPSPTKQSGADPRVRKRRVRGTPPPSNRYQLRQRPTPSSHTSAVSRCSHQASSTSKSRPRRTRRVR
ncbi:hypothetical protein L210DRAFT_842173 [Boletus edulis BED1]|uniref:Uncharacterized protein n=1 Tax=Boletus edulis BED1 TaxID=1328754 RepID=A0AAD4C6N5_BOLED|nr:hypothetical protein L210DRAFT_842173 [Boletus edulis BED1]